MGDEGREPGAVLHVGVVCSGNICRSPYAEAVLRTLARDSGRRDLEFSSAGTLGIVDSPAHPVLVEIGEARGYDLSAHRSQAASAAWLRSCDLVLCMEPEQTSGLRLAQQTRAERIFVFAGYPSASLDTPAVPDPIGGTLEEFYEACDQIEATCQRVLTLLPRDELPPAAADAERPPATGDGGR